jgi:ABC-type phosphate transport system substrate-binding protein
MKRRLLVLSLLAALFPATSGFGAGGFKVVVHPDNPAASISREQLAQIFLKKSTAWPGGKRAVPVDQSEGSAARAAFCKQVLQKTVSEVKAYWQQQIFSGRSVPPVEKTSDGQVLSFVLGNELAVGYVSDGADTGSAKVLRVE